MCQRGQTSIIFESHLNLNISSSAPEQGAAGCLCNWLCTCCTLFPPSLPPFHASNPTDDDDVVVGLSLSFVGRRYFLSQRERLSLCEQRQITHLWSCINCQGQQGGFLVVGLNTPVRKLRCGRALGTRQIKNWPQYLIRLKSGWC